jgi:hypothetical protein
MQRVVRFDEPGIVRRQLCRRDRGADERRRAARFVARSEQRRQKPVAVARALEVERHSHTAAFEPAPQLVTLDGDVLPVDLNDDAAGRVGGVELRLERRIDLLKEGVNLAAPGDEHSAPPQQRLRFVLEARRVAFADLADAGV